MKTLNPQICLIYGLQGCGKTTVSVKLLRELKKKQIKKIKLVDGDIFRRKINNYKYDKKSRKKVSLLKYQYLIKFYKKNYFLISSSVTGEAFTNAKKSNINLVKILLTCSEKDRLKRLNLRNSKNFSNIKKFKFNYNKSDYDLKINTSRNNLSTTLKKIKSFLFKIN